MQKMKSSAGRIMKANNRKNVYNNEQELNGDDDKRSTLIKSVE